MTFLGFHLSIYSASSLEYFKSIQPIKYRTLSDNFPAGQSLGERVKGSEPSEALERRLSFTSRISKIKSAKYILVILVYLFLLFPCNRLRNPRLVHI